MMHLRYWPLILLILIASEVAQISQGFFEIGRHFQIGMLALTSSALHILGLRFIWLSLRAMAADQHKAQGN